MGHTDLPLAWEVVRQTNRPNGGNLIDTWHLKKGTADFEFDRLHLTSILKEYVHYFQIAGALVKASTGSLYDEGDFVVFQGMEVWPIERIVSIVLGKDELRYIGLEIFGNVIDSLATAEDGQCCE